MRIDTPIDYSKTLIETPNIEILNIDGQYDTVTIKLHTTEKISNEGTPTVDINTVQFTIKIFDVFSKELDTMVVLLNTPITFNISVFALVEVSLDNPEYSMFSSSRVIKVKEATSQLFTHGTKRYVTVNALVSQTVRINYPISVDHIISYNIEGTSINVGVQSPPVDYVDITVPPVSNITPCIINYVDSNGLIKSKSIDLVPIEAEDQYVINDHVVGTHKVKTFSNLLINSRTGDYNTDNMRFLTFSGNSLVRVDPSQGLTNIINGVDRIPDNDPPAVLEHKEVCLIGYYDNGLLTTDKGRVKVYSIPDSGDATLLNTIEIPMISNNGFEYTIPFRFTGDGDTQNIAFGYVNNMYFIIYLKDENTLEIRRYDRAGIISGIPNQTITAPYQGPISTASKDANDIFVSTGGRYFTLSSTGTLSNITSTTDMGFATSRVFLTKLNNDVYGVEQDSSTDTITHTKEISGTSTTITGLNGIVSKSVIKSLFTPGFFIFDNSNNLNYYYN